MLSKSITIEFYSIGFKIILYFVAN